MGRTSVVSFVALLGSVTGGLATTATTVTAAGPPPLALTTLTAPVGSGAFGSAVHVLPNGNIVVVDSAYDIPAAADVGAVVLYDGLTHARISIAHGSHASEHFGTGQFVVVGDSNFVVAGDGWTDVATGLPGAATWFDGSSGLDGAVSGANSLIGATPQSIDVLTDGAYVVDSPYWNNGPAGNAGAVTWADGNVGVHGTITAANSLIGTQADDFVGLNGITVLHGGHYVVGSPFWDNASTADVGASTWSPGGQPSAGPVSTANSLIGAHLSDHVGSDTVALQAGGYVTVSSTWDNASTTDAGAATWGDSTAGTTGVVGVANSIVGTTAFDHLGSGGITTLVSGNYVVVSPEWHAPGAPAAGAATFGTSSGTTHGPVSAANSLVGSHPSDQVGLGGIVALHQGHYVVLSPIWDAGVVSDAGAATWGNGFTGGVSGVVSSANSYTGASPDDSVGSAGVLDLSNGDYVVLSPGVDITAQDTGAVTWGNAGGSHGVVSAANSVVGDQAGDRVGSHGAALTGVRYVVSTESWHNGVGAATTLGPQAHTVVSAANSIVGSFSGDHVGQSIVTLATGDAVVVSPMWGNGGNLEAGAVTWVGLGSATGAVSPANSLVGSVTGDHLGLSGVTRLANGNYVVASPEWSSDNRGAVTLGDGASGTVGVVNSTNSVLGTAAGQAIGDGGGTEVARGMFAVRTVSIDAGAATDAGAYSIIARGWPLGDASALNTVFGQVTDEGQVITVADHLTAAGEVAIGLPSENSVVLAISPDDVHPVFPAQHDTVSAVAAPSASSVVVSYVLPFATDDRGPVTVTCTPPSGSLFPAGRSTVTCTATDVAHNTATTQFDVVVTVAAAPPPADFVPTSPARLVDTRPGYETIDGIDAGQGALAAGTVLAVPVAGRGGIGGTAAAVSLNVTAVDPAGSGYLTVFPCGIATPVASNLNMQPGATVANAVIAQIGTGGTVCITASVTTHVLVDASGWFPPSTTYRPVGPARLLDTRLGSGVKNTGGSVTELHVAGREGVAVDATSVVLNLTITEQETAGYTTVYPCGSPRPLASNANAVAGSTVANLVIAKIGVGGNVCIFTQATTHLVVDVDGFLTSASSYHGLVPARLLETRKGLSTIDGVSNGIGQLGVGSVTAVRVRGRGDAPVDATAAVLNVTVVDPVADGYITVFPCDGAPPVASNVNFVAGQTVPNAVVTKLSAGGSVCVLTSQPTDVVIDIAGTFA